MNMKKFACFVVIFFSTGLSALADIYKYKDADGNWRYTDVPPRSDVKFEVISKKKEESNKSLKIMTKEEAIQAATIQKSDKPNVVDKKNAESTKDALTAKADAEKLKAAQLALAEENAAIKQENCKTARMNLATYQQGGRVRKMNEKGEPVLLSDADLASGRVSAQKEVDQYCE
jgi:ribosomal protein L16 Arg81 hydroxylase